MRGGSSVQPISCVPELACVVSRRPRVEASRPGGRGAQHTPATRGGPFDTLGSRRTAERSWPVVWAASAAAVPA